MRVTLKPNAKLSREQVIEIRKRLSMGISSVAEEAVRYGVGRETIRRANRGETWGELHTEGADFNSGLMKPIAPLPTEEVKTDFEARMLRLQEEVDRGKRPIESSEVVKEMLKRTAWAASLGLVEEIKMAPEMASRNPMED